MEPVSFSLELVSERPAYLLDLVVLLLENSVTELKQTACLQRHGSALISFHPLVSRGLARRLFSLQNYHRFLIPNGLAEGFLEASGPTALVFQLLHEARVLELKVKVSSHFYYNYQ